MLTFLRLIMPIETLESGMLAKLLQIIIWCMDLMHLTEKVSDWNTDQVTSMHGMFYLHSGNWDVFLLTNISINTLDP